VRGSGGSLRLELVARGDESRPGGAAFFGGGHHWRHNWQWELDVADGGECADSASGAVATVREPSGTAYQFTHDTSGDAGAWAAVSPAVRHTLRAVQDDAGGGFVLQRLDGMQVHFGPGSESGDGETHFVPTEIRDPQNNVWVLSYDEAGHLSQVREPAGRTLRVAYEALTSPTTAEDVVVIREVTASDGQTVAYHYDFPEGVDYPVLSGATYPDDTRARYAYAAPRAGDPLLLVSADDPHAERSIRGRAFIYRTEPEAALGHLHEIRTIDGEGLFYRLEAASENPEERRYAITQDNGAMRYETYNPGGNLAESVDALGFTFIREYDAGGRGQRSTETNELGEVTRFEHDANGHLAKTTFPDGSTRLQTWDGSGHLLSQADELGNTTRFSYDAKGRLITVQQADGTALEATYSDFGQVTHYTTPAGASTELSYDGAGHLISQTDPAGRTRQYTYDQRGRRTQITSALGHTATTIYDAAGRKLSETDPAGNVTQWTYDALGRELTKTNPNGETTTRAYDADGHLITLSDASGNTHRFAYDLAGNQTDLLYNDLRHTGPHTPLHQPRRSHARSLTLTTPMATAHPSRIPMAAHSRTNTKLTAGSHKS